MPRRARLLSALSRLREKSLAVGETIGLEKEAEQHGAIRRDRLMLIAGGAPDELAWPAFALVVLERALDHVGLFQRGVLVQRHDGARIKLGYSPMGKR